MFNLNFNKNENYHPTTLKMETDMHRSRKFCQRGSIFDNVCLFFLVDGRIENPQNAINGPSSAHQQNAIEMAFCWRADGGPTLNTGILAWKLCDFSGDLDQICKETL